MGKQGVALAVVLGLVSSDCIAAEPSDGHVAPNACTSRDQRHLKHVAHLAGFIDNEDSADCAEVVRREVLETQALNQVGRQMIDHGDFIEIRGSYRATDYYFFSKQTSPAYPWAVKFQFLPIGEPRGLITGWTLGLPPKIGDNATTTDAAAHWLKQVEDIAVRSGYKAFFNVEIGKPPQRAPTNGDAPASETDK